MEHQISPPKITKARTPRQKIHNKSQSFSHSTYQSSPQFSLSSPSSISPKTARYSNSNENTFLQKIDTFLETELADAHSDADKVNVYQRAFGLLCDEFQTCRPLLERIKQQYDLMSSKLIARKREIITDTSSVSTAEDNFSEMINKMRRARTREFAEAHEESDRLLDEMTNLRLQRSELMKELESLQAQRTELKAVEASHSQKMAEINSHLHELMDEIVYTDNQTNKAQKEIETLQEKIGKTRESAEDLQRTNDTLDKELAELLEEENSLKKDLEASTKESSSIDLQLIELHKELSGLEREKADALEKLHVAESRQKKSTDKMREMLKDIEDDPNVPILDIIKRLIENH